MIVDVAVAVDRLRAGEVVAYPTETVFGLGADARDPAAVARLLALKGREAERAPPVLIPDALSLRRWVPEPPARALELIEAWWPGPLTLVLPVAPGVLEAVASGLGVGFRCSAHPRAAALVAALDGPLVSSSANRTGEPPCADAAAVRRVFGPGLPVLGGEAGGLAPSTVVAVAADGEIRVLRPGPIDPGDR